MNQKKGQRAILYVMLGIVSVSYARVIEQSISVHFVRERVNGVVFTHQLEMTDGVIKRRYTINGAVVDGEKYMDEILKAEREERRKEREREYQQCIEQKQFQHKARVALTKKIVISLVDILSKKLSRFDLCGVRSYCAFSSDTFQDEEAFGSFDEKYLVPARQAIVCDDDNVLFELQSHIKKLEPLQDKMDRFFQETIQRAIKECADTKMLKQFLELLS